MTAPPSLVDDDRRRLLVAAVGLPLLAVAGSMTATGCSADRGAKTPPSQRLDADARVRWTAIRGEQALLALHAAVAAAHPALAGPLQALTAHHTEHLEVLRADGPLPVAADAVAEPVAATVPPEVSEAVALLRDTERAAAETAVLASLGSAGTRLAALLASVAASEAAHDVVLESM